MLAVGIVQDMFAGETRKGKEAKRRRLEATSTATSAAAERLPFLST